MLEEAYDKVSLNTAQVYELHKRFHDVCVSVNDNLHCRQLSTLTNNENSWACVQSGA
jgi:hypothetical protein